MSVVLSMREVGPCRQELIIEVPTPAVEAETDRVVGEYRRTARLPGFRKGKAPRELVTRKYGKEIRQEVVDRLVPRYWHQAEAEKELDPLLPPELAGVEFELGAGMTFTAVVETRPAVELGSLEGFSLPEMEVEPPPEDVESELTALRRRFGTWKEVSRPAARGDLVRVTVDRGKGAEPDPLTFEVGEERVWEELSLAATGLAPGQKSTFERADEEGASQQFTVTVEAVEELELAELTDELVKENLKLESAAELTERVTENLRRARRRERRRRREEALLEQLRQQHPLTLPEGVVHQEMESMLRDYAGQMASQGVDLERAEIDWAALGERVRPEAEKAVHGRLLLDAVAEAHELEVPEEKLEELLAGIAKPRGGSTLTVRRELDRTGRLAQLRRQLRRQEAVSELLGERGAEPQPREREAEEEGLQSPPAAVDGE